MTLDHLRKKIKKLPASPGIYLFSARGGSVFGGKKILYIGKALNLKNRVKSYFKTRDIRLQKMLSKTDRLDFIKTDSDIEALLLESQYIKKYQPPFNIMLRDDKQYFYVSFTEEKFPKIFLTHQPIKRGQDPFYVGPFTEGNALKTTLRLLRKIFPYCTCTQTHHNYCLNYHIGKCPGFCCLKQQNQNLKVKNQNAKLYEKNVKAIREILSGGKSSLIKELEKEMTALSNKQKYEKALELQYKIGKLKRVFDNARIISERQEIMIYHNNDRILKLMQRELRLSSRPHRIEAYDIANIQGTHAVGAMAVFVNGIPDKNEYRKFKIYTKNTIDDPGMLKEILIRRFKHPEWPAPDLIIVDGGKAQLNAGQSIITNYNLPITIIALTKNKKHIGHKITMERKEISLSKLPLQLKNFFLNINEESHRFTINYYRTIHRKNLKF